MSVLKQIYNDLLGLYGRQGWWPVTPVGGCRGDLPEGPIYGIGLKNDKQRLEIIFGAVLTQNTQWKPNVERAIIELNRLDLIDIDRILNANHEVIANAIKSSGYFNEKAKKLKKVAEFLKKNPIARLRKTDLRRVREMLLDINGVGPETADSILLYALDRPIFVVDAYTRRIFSRLGLVNEDASYGDVQAFFMENLKHDARLFNEYHALIVEHGKVVCTKKPVCNECVLGGFCPSGKL